MEIWRQKPHKNLSLDWFKRFAWFPILLRDENNMHSLIWLEFFEEKIDDYKLFLRTERRKVKS